MRNTLSNINDKNTQRWQQDPSARHVLLPGGITLDPTQFPGDSDNKVELTAAAAVDAVSLTVKALKAPLALGTILSFGGKKFARVSANVAVSLTVVPVDALPTALLATDVATVPGADGAKNVAGGTPIGRKGAEFEFGPAAADDDEIYLLWKTVDLVNEGPLAEAVRGCAVFEYFLPAPLPAAIKAILVDRGFQFLSYSSTGSDE